MKPVRSEILLRIQRDRLKLSDTSELMLPGEIESHFDRALLRHSDFSFNVKTAHFDGGFIKYHLPSDWVIGSSKITELRFFSGGRYTGEKIKSAVDIYDQVDTTGYNVATVSAGATTVTLSTVGYAARFKADDPVVLVNAGAEVEDNRVSTDGNGISGAVGILTPAGNTYSSSPQIKFHNYFRLRQDAPDATDLFVLSYSIPHVYTEDANEITVPESECDAVADLTAAYAARALAALFSTGAISSIESDTFDSGTNADRWTALADKYEGQYKERMGIKTDENLTR